jgi:1-acyl-sn-glycerol-3-phosphate acyltransferase
VDNLSDILLWLLVLAIGLGLHRLSGHCLAAARADWGRPWLNRLDGCVRRFARHWHRLHAVELAIPETGPAILVSNHISGLDPLLMVTCSRRPLRFLIAREQYGRFGLRWLFRVLGCIPVDRERSPEKAMRAAFRALRNGEVIALFPHGRIHLDSDPPRRLKAGAVRLALHTGAPLIPMRITGVRRQGHVLSPLFLRARAVVAAYRPIDPAGRDPDEVLVELQAILEARADGVMG